VKILGPGSKQVFENNIKSLRSQFPEVDGRSLDIGGGPQSWLWLVGNHPIGLDTTISYCKAFHDKSETITMDSATQLPFPSENFREVWSFGLFHHLPDKMAQ